MYISRQHTQTAANAVRYSSAGACLPSGPSLRIADGSQWGISLIYALLFSLWPSSHSDQLGPTNSLLQKRTPRSSKRKNNGRLNSSNISLTETEQIYSSSAQHLCCMIRQYHMVQSVHMVCIRGSITTLSTGDLQRATFTV